MIFQKFFGRIVTLLQLGLRLCFLLLCLRFIAAAIFVYPPSFWTAIALSAGSMGMGYRSPGVALLSFAIAGPLLDGLGQTGLLGCLTPSSLVFSSVYVGASLRMARRDKRVELREPQSKDKQGVLLATDGLIAAILLSLLVHTAQHWSFDVTWTNFWQASRPSQYSFQHAAFIWLQGLFFFRLLAERNFPKESSFTAIFLWFSFIVAFFYFFQVKFGIPEPYESRFQYSPLEDIHSFGSVVVALFGYVLASWPKNPFREPVRSSLPAFGLRVLWAAALGYLVISSWSRATWIAALVALAAVCILRLSWKRIAVFASSGLVWILAFNFYLAPKISRKDLYAARLSSLLRFESLASKDPARINLYRKAFAMIQHKPLVGYGIGSFYLTSVTFARADDIQGKFPNYAHNFILQFAAELGLPVTLVFLGLTGYILYRGLMTATRIYAGSEMKYFGFASTGIFLALAAYLTTQMTANSLNIYISNQFLFWFLMAGTLANSAEVFDRKIIGTAP